MAHLPTPWRISDDGFIVSGDSFAPITVADTHCADPRAVSTGDMDDTAERIVACVNVCAGIADPMKFIPDLIGSVVKLSNQIGDLTRERDAALTRERVLLADLEGTMRAVAKARSLLEY